MADAILVRLAAHVGKPQAQLDGFKSRALRAEAPRQRHLYATEWCQTQPLVVGRVVTLFAVRTDEAVGCERHASDAQLSITLQNVECAAIAAAAAMPDSSFSSKKSGVSVDPMSSWPA